MVIFLLATAQVSAPIDSDLASASQPIAGVVLMLMAAFAPYLTYKAISFMGFDMHHAMSAEQETKSAMNRPMPIPLNRQSGSTPRKVLGGGRAQGGEYHDGRRRSFACPNGSTWGSPRRGWGRGWRRRGHRPWGRRLSGRVVERPDGRRGRRRRRSGRVVERADGRRGQRRRRSGTGGRERSPSPLASAPAARWGAAATQQIDAANQAPSSAAAPPPPHVADPVPASNAKKGLRR